LVSFFSRFFISVIFVSFQANAEEPDPKVIAEINKQIDAQKAKIDALTDKIKEYQTGLNANKQEKLTLQNQLMFLENQIAKINLEIELKEAEAKAITLNIEQLSLEIKKTEEEIEKEKDKLGELIRVINRYEEKNHITVLLAHESFSEFFDQIKYSNDLQKNLQKTLNRFKESEREITKRGK
jgi:septal ring factor EnvC (AmiA/AmiB activator)